MVRCARFLFPPCFLLKTVPTRQRVAQSMDLGRQTCPKRVTQLFKYSMSIGGANGHARGDKIGTGGVVGAQATPTCPTWCFWSLTCTPPHPLLPPPGVSALVDTTLIRYLD
jgi:hypothetical protein